MKTFGALQMADHLKEITRLRVPARTQHSHQALRRPLCASAQFLESDRRVDVVAQYRFSRVEVSSQETFDTFRRGSLRYLRSDLRRACTVSLNSRVRGMSLLLRFSLFVVVPAVVSRRDVPILPLLRSASEQNHDRVAVLAEIHAVTGAEIDPVSKTPAPTPLTFEKLPSSNRRIAVVTFAAAVASSARNHSANGFEPSRARNSRMINIAMVTHELP